MTPVSWGEEHSHPSSGSKCSKRIRSRCNLCNWRVQPRRVSNVDHPVPYIIAGEATDLQVRDFSVPVWLAPAQKSWECEHCETRQDRV